jgi:biopolymer transport protein ExbD
VAISASSSKGGVNADINVTPMADVMLVLLIIFMITAPLIAAGFYATMPDGVNLIKSEEKPDDVVLGIDRDGKYFVNTHPRTSSDAQLELTSIYANRTKDKILFLKADKSLKMSVIQDAIAMARKAGVAVVSAITDQRPGSEPLVSADRPKAGGN